MKGKGLTSHVDLKIFEDSIVLANIYGTCFMTFSRLGHAFKRILSEVGDMLVLTGEAR